MRPLLLIVLFLILAAGVLAIALVEKAVEPDGAPPPAPPARQWGSVKPPYVVDEQMLTTTTTARARTAPTVRTASTGNPVVVHLHDPGFVNGHPCGGLDLPSCRSIKRESNGVPTAYNATGCGGRSCGGLAQFDPVTWIPGCSVVRWDRDRCATVGTANADGTPSGTYMGFKFAHQAPVDVQYLRIREVYAHGAGCGHWGASECVGIR